MIRAGWTAGLLYRRHFGSDRITIFGGVTEFLFIGQRWLRIYFGVCGAYYSGACGFYVIHVLVLVLVLA